MFALFVVFSIFLRRRIMIQKFEFCKTDFDGAFLIKPFCATDVRGAFIKDYSKEVFEANGLEHNLAEVF